MHNNDKDIKSNPNQEILGLLLNIARGRHNIDINANKTPKLADKLIIISIIASTPSHIDYRALYVDPQTH